MRRELLLFLFAIGCGPQDAPTELDALTHYLYREWASDLHMQDAVLKLDAQKFNLDGDTDDRAYHVTPLDRDDLSEVDWPSTRDPHAAIGSCVVRRSKWPIDDQVKLIQSPNQLAAEPSASAYTRHFMDPTDPACFTAQGCSPLLTDNDITRDNSALTISYLLHKHLRWVRLGPDRWAIAARSYTDKPFTGQKDGTAINQSYSIDIFLAQADARTVRYQCSWSETKLTVDIDDGIELAVLVDGVDRALAAADDAIEKLK